MFIRKVYEVFGNISSKKLLCLLFLISFGMNFFLMQGIPFYMYGNDVFGFNWIANTNSWDHLFRVLFTERISLDTDNPGYFYASEGQRTTNFIIVKAFLAFDGMTEPSIRVIVNVVIFSLSAVLLFLILTHLNVNKMLSFFGALIYGTSVPTYSILSHIGDASLYYNFFTLLCFYLFLIKYLKQEKTNPIFLSIFIFISVVLALKSKQIAIIIPLCLFLYCLFVKQNVTGIIKRRIPIFSILLLYYLPNLFRSGVHRTVSELFLSLKTYYLYNPWTKIAEGELLPALFSPIKSYTVAAGSLMGIYKFLFGWVVIVFFIFFLISIYQTYKKEKKIECWNILSFILLWHFLEVAIMTTYFKPLVFEAIRLIGIATPSFIVFTFYSMQNGLNFIVSKEFAQKYKHIIYCIIIISIMMVIASNFYVSAIQIRGGLLSRHTLIHDSIFVVYKDYFNKQEIDDTIFFTVFDEFSYPLPRDKEEALGNLFYTELAAAYGIPYERNNQNEVNNIDEINKKIEEKGFVYIATFKDDVPFQNKVLLAKLSSCPPESSTYCYLKDKIKGQKVFFYVFKIFNDNLNELPP